MAEWLSTEFFQTRIAATRDRAGDLNTSRRPIQSAFANGADEIDYPAQDHQDRETQCKEQFSSDQFAYEIDLKNEENSQNEQKALAYFRLFDQPRQHCLQLREMRFHDPPTLTVLDARRFPNGAHVSH